jgi:hypothetical protein
MLNPDANFSVMLTHENVREVRVMACTNYGGLVRNSTYAARAAGHGTHLE